MAGASTGAAASFQLAKGDPKPAPSVAALRACLLKLRERAAKARRTGDVEMIDAALEGDIRASILAATGPLSLTERQWQILEIIERQRQELGYAPTYDDMAAELKLSKATVFEHVEALKQRGVLAVGQTTHRGLYVVPREEKN
jgi:DNA-binding NarL/FixJ family response regulator